VRLAHGAQSALCFGDWTTCTSKYKFPPEKHRDSENFCHSYKTLADNFRITRTLIIYKTNTRLATIQPSYIFLIIYRLISLMISNLFILESSTLSFLTFLFVTEEEKELLNFLFPLSNWVCVFFPKCKDRIRYRTSLRRGSMGVGVKSWTCSSLIFSFCIWIEISAISSSPLAGRLEIKYGINCWFNPIFPTNLSEPVIQIDE